jgi:hypothetical protein
MRLKSFFAIVAFTAPFSAAVAPAEAQDASFGCKVLLCAAAVSPSWSGIPYCVPVMTQLFRQLARGGGWPSCAEGGANSGLGYEPYQACPAGTQPYAASNGSPTYGQSNSYSGGDNGPTQSYGQGSTYGGGGDNGTTPPTWISDPNGGYCADPNQLSQNYAYTPIPRDARPDPYFVDLTPSGQATQRFYFSIRGY